MPKQPHIKPSHHHKIHSQKSIQKFQMSVFMFSFALIGVLTLFVTSAQTERRYAVVEPETGSHTGVAKVVNDSSASGGKYLRYEAAAVATPPVVLVTPSPTPQNQKNCNKNYDDLTLSTPQKKQLTLYTTNADRICIKSLTNVRLVVFGPYQYTWVGNIIYDAAKTPGGAHRDAGHQKNAGDRVIYIRGCQLVSGTSCVASTKAGLMEVDNLEIYNSADDGIQITNADITVNRFIMKNVWAGNTGIYDPALGSAIDQSPHTDGAQAQGKSTVRINNFDWDTISWAGFIGHNETTSLGSGPIKVYLSNGRIANIGSNRLPASVISGLQSKAASQGKLFQHVGGNGLRFYGKKALPQDNLNELHLDGVTLESTAGNGMWFGPDIRAWSVKNSTFYRGIKLYDGWNPPAPLVWSNNTIKSPTTGYYQGPK